MSNGKAPIAWPWFIVGCVLLLAALVAFFWGFALGDLTSSQRSLLMWLLPLASGFAAGCFAGSLHATGTVGTVTISAFGGFAVWVLSYFLLPSGEPHLPPDSVAISLPSDMTFRQAAEMIVENDNQTAVFSDCDQTALGAKLRGGTISGRTHGMLLEGLKYRLINSTDSLSYRVEHLKDRGIYEIRCTH